MHSKVDGSLLGPGARVPCAVPRPAPAARCKHFAPASMATWATRSSCSSSRSWAWSSGSTRKRSLPSTGSLTTAVPLPSIASFLCPGPFTRPSQASGAATGTTSPMMSRIFALVPSSSSGSVSREEPPAWESSAPLIGWLLCRLSIFFAVMMALVAACRSRAHHSAFFFKFFAIGAGFVVSL